MKVHIDDGCDDKSSVSTLTTEHATLREDYTNEEIPGGIAWMYLDGRLQTTNRLQDQVAKHTRKHLWKDVKFVTPKIEGAMRMKLESLMKVQDYSTRSQWRQFWDEEGRQASSKALDAQRNSVMGGIGKMIRGRNSLDTCNGVLQVYGSIDDHTLTRVSGFADDFVKQCRTNSINGKEDVILLVDECVMKWKFVIANDMPSDPKDKKVFAEQYNTFFEKVVSIVVGKRNFTRNVGRCSLDLFVSCSDEAFACLALENSLERWLYSAARQVCPCVSSSMVQQTAYTTADTEECRPLGWSLDGKLRYFQLRKEVEKKRKSGTWWKDYCASFLALHKTAATQETARSKRKENVDLEKYEELLQYEDDYLTILESISD